MTIYIDCEFDGFRGDLVSMALVNDDNYMFYGVLKTTDFKEQWVTDNVEPVIFKGDLFDKHREVNLYPVYDYVRFRTLVWGYLDTHMFEGETIVADFPDDLFYLMDLLSIPGGKRCSPAHMKFEIRNIDYVSEVPHNALYDAIAIKRADHEANR